MALCLWVVSSIYLDNSYKEYNNGNRSVFNNFEDLFKGAPSLETSIKLFKKKLTKIKKH